MIRHQSDVNVPPSALRAGLGWTEWPARMQRLAPGPLSDLLPKGSELWLDGGHNPAAARVVADALRELAHDRSEEHTSELQSLMRISYAVFCLKKKKKQEYVYEGDL